MGCALDQLMNEIGSISWRFAIGTISCRLPPTHASSRTTCDLNQFLAAIGSNYLPQVQTKPRDFASPPCLRFVFLEPLNCRKCKLELTPCRKCSGRMLRGWADYIQVSSQSAELRRSSAFPVQRVVGVLDLPY